jgi:hypothetical protein
MNMPGFSAEASLGRPTGRYQGNAVPGGVASEGSEGMIPQARFGGDPDLGDYLRCRANGGGELVCRFFGGLPPWTIGGVLF